MNLLIYIGGWLVGQYVMYRLDPKFEEGMTASTLGWTMLWIGICWRFIR